MDVLGDGLPARTLAPLTRCRPALCAGEHPKSERRPDGALRTARSGRTSRLTGAPDAGGPQRPQHPPLAAGPGQVVPREGFQPKHALDPDPVARGSGRPRGAGSRRPWWLSRRRGLRRRRAGSRRRRRRGRTPSRLRAPAGRSCCRRSPLTRWPAPADPAELLDVDVQRARPAGCRS